MSFLWKIARPGVIPSPQLCLRAFSMSSAHRDHHQPFQNKTAVVTGSTDGIGFAIARRLARDGAFVVISSRKKQNVDRALASLRQDGLNNVTGLVCDAGSKKDRAALIEHTLGQRPGIDILVSNVATVVPSAILETTEENWDSVLDLNLKSHFLLTQEALPHITSQKKGSVVYISSVAGFIPFFEAGSYGISKIALFQLTKQAAAQLGPLNIRVNCVAPGLINTEMAKEAVNNEAVRSEFEKMTMLKRIGQPDEIAGVVAFLCSDDASYVTGETIIASGGMHCRI